MLVFLNTQMVEEQANPKRFELEYTPGFYYLGQYSSFGDPGLPPLSSTFYFSHSLEGRSETAKKDWCKTFLTFGLANAIILKGRENVVIEDSGGYWLSSGTDYISAEATVGFEWKLEGECCFGTNNFVGIKGNAGVMWARNNLYRNLSERKTADVASILAGIEGYIGKSIAIPNSRNDNFVELRPAMCVGLAKELLPLSIPAAAEWDVPGILPRIGFVLGLNFGRKEDPETRNYK